jgi:hypothetical protein
MRWLLVTVLLMPLIALGQQRPTEIDPNTKIEGGADAPGSGAGIGPDRKLDPAEPEREPTVRTEKIDPKEDKPISARRPQDVNREREEEAAKGETAKPQ